MELLRKNTKHCSVGEYDFDIAINRQITLDGLKKFPKLWKAMMKGAKVSPNVENMEDITAIADLLEMNDILEEELPKFTVYVLPKMVELAGGEPFDYDKFREYLVENEVDGDFDQKIYEFAMLGFTGDKSEKKAKVAMSLT